jgi:hypothetical protein
MDKIRITVHDNVWIVRDDYDLPVFFHTTYLLHDKGHDHPSIEVILWLIEHKWLFAKGEQEREDRCGLLSDGALGNGFPSG